MFFELFIPVSSINLLIFVQNLKQFTEFWCEDDFGSAVSSFGFFAIVRLKRFVFASACGYNPFTVNV
jgi:hypothetical protein